MSLLAGNGHDERGVYRDHSAERNNIFSLSVEAWTLIESFDPESRGCVTECGEYSLRIQGTQISIFKVSTSASCSANDGEIFTLTLGTDISSAEIPRTPNTSMPFIAFLLHQTNNTKALFDAYTNTGTKHPRKPSIAVKIPKVNSGWNLQSYNQIDDHLRAGHISICYLDDIAIGTIWKRLMSACNDSHRAKFATQSVKAQSSLTDVDDVRQHIESANQNGQNRPPEFNLIARAKRGRTFASKPGTRQLEKRESSCVTSPIDLTRSESAVTSKHPHPQATMPQCKQRLGPQCSRSHLLPIRAWVLGTKLVESEPSESSERQYWLRVRDSYVSILKGSPAIGTLSFEFDLNMDITSVELPQDHDVAGGFPLIVLSLCETDRTGHFIRKNSTLDRKPPTVAIKLSSSHTAWSLATYEEIESLIKASKVIVRSLNAPAVRIRWQTLTRSQGSQAVADSADALSPQTQTPGRRPKPRPTYIGGEDNLTHLELKSSQELVERSNDATSGRDDAASPKSFMIATTKQARTTSVMIHKPLAIDADIAITVPSQGVTEVVGDLEDGMEGAKGTRVTELIMNSASSEKSLGMLSDSLGRNHQEVRGILQQALDLLDNTEP